ncbi:MAG TPA: hypothetical protein DEQ09_09340 [Bacteroidales bacterium]|nr:hypothetical protein [Bacteroidales bacterium]
MKKIALILAFFIPFTSILYSQFTKLGGGLSYSTGYYFNNEDRGDHKTGNPVISATGIYKISLPVHIKSSINVFIPNISKLENIDYTDKRVISAFSLDIDGHYVFNYLDRFEFYGLAGLNIMMVRMRYKNDYPGISDDIRSSDSAMGLNIGAGTYVKLKDDLDLYLELKALLGKQVQGVITAGIMLNIDWKKQHDDPEL